MYKVLIAEDELLTRAGIVSSVNWAELNMQIVAQADDGIQALQLYRTHYPEIVVTDLNMPRLGGVELIGKICEEERPCKIIVVTCVEDVQVITSCRKSSPWRGGSSLWREWPAGPPPASVRTSSSWGTSWTEAREPCPLR